MDNPEAARLLGVAESEVVDVKAEAGWWHALHHDMASHLESWRPFAQLVGSADDPVTFVGESGPEIVDLPPGAEVVPADDSPEPDPSTEGSAGSGSGDQVPDGPAKDVLAWVGDDSDRAVAALEAEEVRDQPRTTLVAALEKVIG